MNASTRFRLLVALLGLSGIVAQAAPPPPPQHRLVLQTPSPVGIGSVAVSPDGSLVASAAGEGGVRLYDARSGAFMQTLGGVGDRNILFTPDGKFITAAGFHMDKLVGIYEVATGKRVQQLAGHTEWEVYANAISPDGKWLASTGTDKQLLVWNLKTGNLQHKSTDLAEKLSALVFSPDSSTLAGGGGDRKIHLWNMTTGTLQKSLPGHSDWISAIAYSADGKAIASGSCDWGTHRGHDWARPPARSAEACEWRLWNAATGESVRTERDSGRLLALAFTPDSKSLAVSIDREVRLYDYKSNAAGRLVASHDGTITSLAFSADGNTIFTGSHDQTVKASPLPTSKTMWQAPGDFEQVNSVAISTDGATLVTGSSDHRYARGTRDAGDKHLGPGTVRIWDLKTGCLVRRLGNPSEQVMAVAISRDARHIVSGGTTRDGSGTVSKWDATTGQRLWTTSDPAQDVLAVALAPKETLLATATSDGTVKLRDAESGRVLHTLPDHQGGCTSLAFSSDGQTLYCGEATGGLLVWNTKSGQLLHRCRGTESRAELFTIDRRMTSVSVSRDGSLALSCGSSVNNEFTSPARLWNAKSGELIREFKAENIHGRPTVLSPDGSLIATGGKSIKLWDVNTGRMLRELYGHLKRTQSIAFSPDGRLIISGGSYGTTNIWEVATGNHLATLFTFIEPHSGALTDDWLAYHPTGYYDGSPGCEKYLAWRRGDQLKTPSTVGASLHRPDRVAAALAGEVIEPALP